MTSSLVIVYHREPYEEYAVDGQRFLKENASPNGIIPALKGVISRVNSASWIAWKELSDEPAHLFTRNVHIDDSYGSYNVVRLPLSRAQIEQFYFITSKEALWPVINSFPSYYSTQYTNWSVFREVNRHFADAICEEAEEGGLVWIHDYNLWLVPGFVRALRPDLSIAFFHHTAFPSADIFSILPWRDEILSSLLQCDLIGFHVPRYAHNFARTAQSLCVIDQVNTLPVASSCRSIGGALSETSVPSEIIYQQRSILIDSCPIGPHTQMIIDFVQTDEGASRVEEIRKIHREEIIIVSVSRIDYSKGIVEMLMTFERLLQRRPELCGRIKLLLTAVSAANGMRVYRQSEQTIEQAVGHINGLYGTLEWVPVVLSTTSMPFEETMCHYRAADICWVTPLRDGLNLVAKEFVASHINAGGVLVLSEFAGAAIELSDAILVNPYSRNQMDAAIDLAIDMPYEEQKQRMAKLGKRVLCNNISNWTDHMLDLFGKISAKRDRTCPTKPARRTFFWKSERRRK